MSVVGDRVAFITGAGSGTGQAIARMLAEDGYSLVLVGRNRAALTDVGATLATPWLLAEADLADAAATGAAMAAGLDWCGGRIDALVNAAGITGPLGKPLGEISVAEFDAVIAVNLRACFVTLSAALPAMYRRKSGRVVSIGGTHGQRGRPGRASYVASKWALRGLHRSAAIEAGPHGVTVNLVMPGPIGVPRMQGLWRAEAAATGRAEAEVIAGYTERMGGVLGRISTPEEIAGVVRFLLSDVATNITGQDITIDGGTIL
ncbi:SDR family NAD(P)-dependent oxidoreductase [Neoroseomonas lacus]|uniref:Beta-ketoacyl-ACP reductase n=1 Tax=Neoroseomonas lacus TaxID=287609 RepID=A0A917NSJ0_9PROT|nr:SDR family oxidoreductase [Neoroseomonas lacus]GGJ23610.1 beta-ketoacyl-ACP reductase [Neoroseomonas lacus]